MKTHTFGFRELPENGKIWFDFLSLRKAVLVDGLGWSLSHDGEFEMDQYDRPRAVYSIVTLENKVVAGARALPTDHVWGGFSYMLKDAVLGKIPTIPTGVLTRVPETKECWECSRLVISNDLKQMALRRRVLFDLVQGLCSLSTNRGATSLISLSPPSLRRLLRGAGFDCNASGPVHRNAEDNRKYQVLTMPSAPISHREIQSKSASMEAA